MMTRSTKKLAATVSAALILNISLLSACTEDPNTVDQPVDDCPGTQYIITDGSEAAGELGIGYYNATSPGPDRLNMSVHGLGGELLGHVEVASDGFRGGIVNTQLAGDPARYELHVGSDGDMFATMNGRPAGRWSHDGEGLVEIEPVNPEAALGIAISATAAGNALDSYALFGFELSSWKCIKLKLKVLALAAACVAGAAAIGVACATVAACVAAVAGTVVACVEYVDEFQAACDCNCWPWEC